VNSALRHGVFEQLYANQQQYAFLRHDSSETLVVVLNAAEAPVLKLRTFEWDQLWPKAIHHRSLGQRPRNVKNKAFLAEGHTHVPHGFGVKLAFGQTNSCRSNSSNSWGVALSFIHKSIHLEEIFNNIGTRFAH
jgi:hypothetical protein